MGDFIYKIFGTKTFINQHNGVIKIVPITKILLPSQAIFSVHNYLIAKEILNKEINENSQKSTICFVHYAILFKPTSRSK